MTKSECLRIESLARDAVCQELSCAGSASKLQVGPDGPTHEFDIYAPGVVIGGVTTGTLTTSGGRRNTGACDRAASELLWLSLWPGTEQRTHVLTDKPLAEWLAKRYARAPLTTQITVRYYSAANNALTTIGKLGPNNSSKPTPLRGAT